MGEAYLEHFRNQVMPELRAFAGFRGATVLTRVHSAGIEITVLTRWETLDAVRAFAGDNVDCAVVAESVRNCFHSYDQSVTHHEVAFEDL